MLLFTNIYDYFYGLPAKREQDILEYKKEQLFLSLSLVANLILMIFIILNYFNHKIIAMYVDIAAVTILLANARFFIKTQKLNVAVFIYSLTIILVTSFLHLVAPVFLSGNILWLPLMIFLSSFLSSKKYAYLLAGIGIILFSIAYILPVHFAITLDIIDINNANIINIASLILSTYVVFVLMQKIQSEEDRVRSILAKSRDHFKESNETSASLVALVTHDLATPLILIKHKVTQLKKEAKNNNSPLISEILDSIDNMEELIKEVKLIRACAGGKLSLDLRDVCMVENLRHIIKDIQHLATAKKVLFKVSLEDEALESYNITAEEHTLRVSVLGNILTNAIKFSKAGSYIDISVSRQSSYLQVIIKDFGIGIPKEIMPHLFDFSSSTSRSGTAGETGTGFGLPLAKMFIDKFDGEITVKSDGYSGTTFILKFKISPSHI